MARARLEFEGGAVAVLNDDGANVDLEVNWPIPGAPQMGHTLHLRAKKEDVQAFLDVLWGTEEEEDVPDQQANGGGRQESRG